MSRIGKKPVSVPAGVTANVSGQLVKIKGSKGELSFEVPEEVSVALENGAIAVQPRSQTKRARALWGTSRARINNLVIGTTAGFEKRLEINGVGYKAAVAGKVDRGRRDVADPVVVRIGDHEPAAGHDRQAADAAELGVVLQTSRLAQAVDAQVGALPQQGAQA